MNTGIYAILETRGAQGYHYATPKVSNSTDICIREITNLEYGSVPFYHYGSFTTNGGFLIELV